MPRAKKVPAKRAPKSERIEISKRDAFISAYLVLQAVSAALNAADEKSSYRLRKLFDDMTGQFSDASIEYAAQLCARQRKSQEASK